MKKLLILLFPLLVLLLSPSISNAEDSWGDPEETEFVDETTSEDTTEEVVAHEEHSEHDAHAT